MCVCAHVYVHVCVCAHAYHTMTAGAILKKYHGYAIGETTPTVGKPALIFCDREG